MVSGPSRNFQLSPDAYVHLAKSCHERSAEKPKNSGHCVRAKECCFCHRVIQLGSGTSDYSLQQHMLSFECQKVQKSLINAGHDLLSPAPQPSLGASYVNQNEVPPRSVPPSSIFPNPMLHDFEACPGAFVDYGLSMFSHYPWHLHDIGFLDYELAYIDPRGRFFLLRSHECHQKSPGAGAACEACNRVVLGRQLQDLLRRAHPDNPPAPTTKIQFRTFAQICRMLQDKNTQLNDFQLKTITVQRRIHSLSGRIDEQKRLMFAIAQSDDGTVGRIIQTALWNGAGVETIIDRIVRAQQGLFSPQNYSQKSFDLVALVLKVSGPRLAFAVSQAMHLPSISTVRNRLNLPQLIPSIGFPTKDQLLANIRSFFTPDSTRSGSQRRSGLSLMIDEIALEPRLRYSVQQDAVIGICREHAGQVDLTHMSTRSDSLDALQTAKHLLDSGACHRATEATMAAIGCFGKSGYNPSVVLASGTCKTERAPDEARWISLLFDAWIHSPEGEIAHGPIWSAATDGDAGRRLALFQLCMTSQVPECSDLFQLIGHLPLLNLCCGPTLITHDGDYKHEEKRLASALRSRSGLMINGAHITPQMLVHYLRQLSNLHESRILSFFDGRDPQNVPKANALLIHLYMASQLPSITSKPENKPFILLGEVLGLFIRPYTVPTMSLTEQLISLVKCAHLLFALYRIDGTRFLPGQLYYDIQASIKNVIFCVAKTQLVGSDLPFYLLQTGTDRLEGQFGTFRTSTSDRNGDLLQMAQRAGSVQFVDQLFSTHQSWNRTPYRLSLDGKSGVDHTNPFSWVGDVIVGNVNLSACWLYARSQASDLLCRCGVPFDFDPEPSSSLKIDLMRPTGLYPGIQIDNLELNLPSVSLSELTDNNTQVDTGASGLESTDETALNISAASGSAENDELDIENLLPPMPDEPAQQDSKRGWITVEGKPVHLESAVRYLLSSDGGAKSTDRLRRVCGYTQYLHPADSRSNSVLGDDFHVSELVATFLRTGNRLVLAIIRVTDIVAGDGHSLESISQKHFTEQGVTLSGQLLELEHTAGVWYWTQQYDTATSTTTKAHRKRRSGFDFGARFARPINPALVGRNGEHVWAFYLAQMNELMDELWGVCAKHSPEDHIPVCEPSMRFPYQESDGRGVLFHPGGSEYMRRTARSSQGPCFQCGEIVDIKHKMRIHVGQHILALQRRSDDADRHGIQDCSLCGFCGRSGTCLTSVERRPGTTKALHAVSNCPYRDDFPYNIKARSSKAHPCTNRPVECPHCPSNGKFIWSYHLQDHVRISHGPQAVDTPNELIRNCQPSDDELTLMRVSYLSKSIQLPQSGKRRREEGDSRSSAIDLESLPTKQRCV